MGLGFGGGRIPDLDRAWMVGAFLGLGVEGRRWPGLRDQVVEVADFEMI